MRMDTTDKRFSLRVLLLIATPKLTDKAAKLFQKEDAPLLYRLHAVGTASSEMMDILGLGTIDKGVLVSLLPKEKAGGMLRQLHSTLRLGLPGSGIAFTMPLSGANALLFRMLDPLAGGEEPLPAERKEATKMEERKHMLIAAIVNQGYSEKVMDAAKAAGARGGSVLHSRHMVDVDSEDAVRFWGLNIQEEKEIILILASSENKLNIMKAIGESCGMRTESQGLVVSLPIDSAIGLGDD